VQGKAFIVLLEIQPVLTDTGARVSSRQTNTSNISFELVDCALTSGFYPSYIKGNDMNTFRRSLLSRSTLLAISTGAISASSLAATPWSETAGAVLDVTSSYSSNVAKDYPLYAEGANSVLQTTSPFLNFVSTGNNLFTAYAKNGGSINVNQGILSSNGNLAHTVNLVGGNLNMTGGVINTAGTNSYGVNGSNEAQASIKDLTINASGGGGGGVTLSAGKLVASNVNIVASGAGSQGISLAYSTFGTANAELDNVDIKLLGAGTKAGIMLGNGTVTGQKVTITSSDDNRGIDVYNAGGKYRNPDAHRQQNNQ
jgi:hypothetical protein